MSGEYECMTPEEYTLWRTNTIDAGKDWTLPCVDCPMWFHLEEVAAGRCASTPRKGGPPPGTDRQSKRAALLRRIDEAPPGTFVGTGGHPRYATDELRIEARRRSWREYRERARNAALAVAQ